MTSQISWTAVVSSSGGSAHLNAAEFLREENEIPLKDELNVMKSGCVFGEWVGGKLSGLYDNAQKRGDVKKQVWLVNLQPLFEIFFFLPAYLTMIFFLLKNGKSNLPHEVIATSPILFPALCWAVRTVNALFSFKGNKIEQIHLYMVEPPTEGAMYYLRILRGLSAANRALVNLHSLEPIDKRLIDDLNLGKITYEPVVCEQLRKRENLPKSGENFNLQLKVEGLENEVYNIKSEDRVGVIMLGGVPTESAIEEYVDAALALSNEPGSVDQHKNYLFIACGNPSDPAMLALYHRMKKKVENQGPRLIVVPFQRQRIDALRARADFTDTRSGGMTSQEIICLKKAAEQRVLIHAQIPEAIPPSQYAHQALAVESVACGRELSNITLREAYQQALIRQGIPLWEGSNAQYLRESVGAEVVTPASAQEIMKEIYFGTPRRSIEFNAELFNQELTAVQKAYEALLFKHKAKQYATLILSSLCILGLATISLLFTSLILLSPWILGGAIALGIAALAIFLGMIYFDPRTRATEEMIK